MKIKEAASKRILVIDNPENVKSYLKVPLELMGFVDIDFVSSTAEADIAISNQLYDLVFCSYSLKTKQDGYYYYISLRQQKRLHSNTVFIFMGSESSLDVIQSVIDFPADAFIVKPFTYEGLRKSVMNCIKRKQNLSYLDACLKAGKHELALEEITNLVTFPISTEYVSRALKIKADLLLKLKGQTETYQFLQHVIDNYGFNWAKVGLVKLQIELDDDSEAEKTILQLVSSTTTKVDAYDLLTRLQIKQNCFDEALQSAVLAAEASPYNIQRQETARLIAKLASNHRTEFKIAQRIIRVVAGSAANEAQHYINAASASLDICVAFDGIEMQEALGAAQRNIAEIRKQFANQDLEQEISILEARVQCIQDNKYKAQETISDKSFSFDYLSLESKVEKAKLLHELGMYDASEELFISIQTELGQPSKKQNDLISKEFLFQQIVNKEKAARKSILQTPKELNAMGLSAYLEGNFDKAFEIFMKAQKLVPRSVGIALNLLQVLVKLKMSKWMKDFSDIIYQCVDVIEQEKTTQEQQIKYAKLKRALGV